MKWYALRVVAGKEKMAKKNIETELSINNLTSYVSDICVPVERYFQLRKDKKISNERVTIPGYVLVKARLVGELPRVLKNTPGVVGFTGGKHEAPTPLKQHEVDKILGDMVESKNAVRFLVGETVTITDGPFKSFKGIVDEVDNNKQQVVVNVKIFGRTTPMSLTYLQIEKGN